MLEENGVDIVFGLPADDLRLPAAFRERGPRLVLCRDQRNAAFSATGYAMSAGRPGVVVVGKGPAVTNTLTGLLEARSSCAPVVVLAAGTDGSALGSGAFQELDQLSVVRPLVKAGFRVERAERVIPMLRRALLTASAGTPGPVYLEIPDHLLRTPIPHAAHTGPVLDRRTLELSSADSETLAVLGRSERPMLLVGGGSRHVNADGGIERLAEALGAGILSTASGRGTVTEDHPFFLGLSGLYAHAAVAPLLEECDCLISLGSRLEETAVFGWPEAIGTATPVVQVNIDAAELSAEFAGPCAVGDVGAMVRAWIRSPAAPEKDPGHAWPQKVAEVRTLMLKERQHRTETMASSRPPLVTELLTEVEQTIPPSRILVQENGLQDMWSYFFPSYVCAERGGSLVPSEQTSLGFGAAAALGVKAACPGRPVVALVGDGAFAMSAADLPSTVDAELPVLYLVLRNGGYGWLRSQAEGMVPTVTDIPFTREERVHTDWARVPGVHSAFVRTFAELGPRLREAWKHVDNGGTAVLNVVVDIADVPFSESEMSGDFPVAAGQIEQDEEVIGHGTE
ncbi:thiamine pyrophosphate-binding protein [Nocardiopsis terrae]